MEENSSGLIEVLPRHLRGGTEKNHRKLIQYFRYLFLFPNKELSKTSVEPYCSCNTLFITSGSGGDGCGGDCSIIIIIISSSSSVGGDCSTSSGSVGGGGGCSSSISGCSSSCCYVAVIAVILNELCFLRIQDKIGIKLYLCVKPKNMHMHNHILLFFINMFRSFL